MRADKGTPVTERCRSALLVVRRDASGTVRVSATAGDDQQAGFVTDPVDADDLVDIEGRHASVRFPDDLLGPLSAWVQTNTHHSAILSLQLIRPCGPIGAVPWERLSAATGRRMIRVADVEPQGDDGIAADPDLLRIGVVASGPSGHADAVVASVAAIDEAVVAHRGDRNSSTDIFTDTPVALALEQRFGRRSDITVHRPPGSTRDGTDGWAEWMVSARTVPEFDMLHVICEADFGGFGQQPRLLLAAPPTAGHSSARPDVPVTDTSLRELAVRLAANGLAIGQISGRSDIDALRGVADAVGARRTKPVFLSTPTPDGIAALRDAYELLAGTVPDIGPAAIAEAMAFTRLPEAAHRGHGGVD